MSTGLLTGKTAVITGSTSGVGRASALLFAREGAAVVATGRRESHLTALRQEIEAEGGRCVTCAGDIADLGLGDELVRLALKETGRVDILLYSAGMALRSSTLDMTPDEWDRVMRVNATAAMFLAIRCIPEMDGVDLDTF